MSETVRIYINAQAIDVAVSATALEAIEAWDETVATEIRNGERVVTDSRGIIMANNSPMHNGAILRIVRARQTADEEHDPSQL